MTATLRERALAGRSLWIDLREVGSHEPNDEHCDACERFPIGGAP